MMETSASVPHEESVPHGRARRSFDEVLRRLIESSDAAAEPPFQRVRFPETLDTQRLAMPEELLSLYHHPVYAGLDAQQRWRLSLLETINFFSINLHGERALVGGLEQRLYRCRAPWDGYEASRYLQRFIHEENSHTHMLAEYCHRYHGRVMPDMAMALDAQALSPAGEDLLFYGRTFVLEGFLSYLNLRVMRDETLEPTTRAVHHAHHGDESRHVAFDRAVLRAIVEQLREQGRDDECRRVADALDRYRQVALRRLYNASIYRAIGLQGGVQLASEARALPARHAIETRWMQTTTDFLARLGLGPQPMAAVAAGEAALDAL